MSVRALSRSTEPFQAVSSSRAHLLPPPASCPFPSCLVARRTDALKEVIAECKAVLLSTPSRLASYDGRRKQAFRTQEEVDKLVLGVVGSVSEVDDMVRAREEMEKG